MGPKASELTVVSQHVVTRSPMELCSQEQKVIDVILIPKWKDMNQKEKSKWSLDNVTNRNSHVVPKRTRTVAQALYIEINTEDLSI